VTQDSIVSKPSLGAGRLSREAPLSAGRGSTRASQGSCGRVSKARGDAPGTSRHRRTSSGCVAGSAASEDTRHAHRDPHEVGSDDSADLMAADSGRGGGVHVSDKLVAESSRKALRSILAAGRMMRGLPYRRQRKEGTFHTDKEQRGRTEQVVFRRGPK